jgi:alpha-mannosidase
MHPHQTLDQTLETIGRLEQMTRLTVQTEWRISPQGWDLDPSQGASLGASLGVSLGSSLVEGWQSWPLAQVNSKNHLAFPTGAQVQWFSQQFTVPAQLQGYPLEGLALRLALTWWAQDAQIFVQGALVQRGDLFDAVTRVLLSPRVQPGDQIWVALRLVSPNNDPGALVSSGLVYEAVWGGSGEGDVAGEMVGGAHPTVEAMGEMREPGFVADELRVLLGYLQAFRPDRLPEFHQLLDQVDWQLLPDRDRFHQSLMALRRNLSQTFDLANDLANDQGNFWQGRSLALLGHSHLDLAWLWPIAETWQVAEHTFESVLSLQQQFPNLTYTHSSPALLAWLETHRPQLFQRIQAQVKTGAWEIAAGMWVEPDLNLISGESIVRQILYGQRYLLEKFNTLSAVAWLPDTFGFCATLPQFLRLGEIEYFVTQKLAWNDTTKFPHDLFWWQGPDGSRVLSLMSAPIGEGIDPIKMGNYGIEWEQKTGGKEALWLVGCGDHGGADGGYAHQGPTLARLSLFPTAAIYHPEAISRSG